MSKVFTLGWGLVAAMGLAACGGGGEGGETTEEPAAGAAAETAGGTMSMPSWMTADTAAKTVTINLVAGETDANNYWNFNGYTNGNATITVPQGYRVTINFTNRDPAMAHSVGVSELTANFPPMFDNPQPVFAGAISSNPTDAVNATGTGKSETITFTAATAGQYSLVCYVPAHALSGMWIKFDVSADGKMGLTTM